MLSEQDAGDPPLGRSGDERVDVRRTVGANDDALEGSEKAPFARGRSGFGSDLERGGAGLGVGEEAEDRGVFRPVAGEDHRGHRTALAGDVLFVGPGQGPFAERVVALPGQLSGEGVELRQRYRRHRWTSL